MKILKIAILILFSLSSPALCQSASTSADFRLTDVQEVFSRDYGDAVSPAPSPSGQYLAFTGEGFKGIKILDLETGNMIEVTNIDGAGFGFEWAPGQDVIAFRGSLGGLKRKHFIGVAHPDGTVEVSSPLLDSLSMPVWKGNDVVFAAWGRKNEFRIAGPDGGTTQELKVVLCDPRGGIVMSAPGGSRREQLEEQGKVFFLPRLSEDGRRFLVHCLDGGIYLGWTEGSTLRKIGEGSDARFARNGSVIVYDRTFDDGHTILTSELFLYDIVTGGTYRLTDTPNAVEMRPAIAKDGRTIFWDQGGKLMRGEIK